MDPILTFIFEHADDAHWIIFLLLMLAGCNFPISEDLLLVISGVLASTVVTDHALRLFIWVFLGCYISDWISYGLGRYFGEKLWKIPWLARTMGSKNRLKRIRRISSKCL